MNVQTNEEILVTGVLNIMSRLPKKKQDLFEIWIYLAMFNLCDYKIWWCQTHFPCILIPLNAIDLAGYNTVLMMMIYSTHGHALHLCNIPCSSRPSREDKWISPVGIAP